MRGIKITNQLKTSLGVNDTGASKLHHGGRNTVATVGPPMEREMKMAKEMGIRILALRTKSKISLN